MQLDPTGEYEAPSRLVQLMSTALGADLITVVSDAFVASNDFNYESPIGILADFSVTPGSSSRILRGEIRPRWEDAVVAFVRSDAAVALFLPGGILSNGSHGQVRSRIVEEIGRPSMIVEFSPERDWGIHASFRMAVVAWIPGSVGTRFVHGQPGAGIANELLDDVARLMRMQGGRRPSGWVVRDEWDARSWSPSAHDPDVARDIEQLETTWASKVLDDVMIVRKGSVKVSPKRNLPDEGPTAPVVTGKDLRRDRLWIDAGDVEACPVSTFDESGLLRRSDLLMRSIRRPGEPIVVNEFRGEDDAFASSTVLVMTPRNEFEDFGTQLVAHYLRSPLAARILDARATTAMHMRIDDLRRLPIPDIGGAAGEYLRTLVNAEQQFSEWARATSDVASRMFAGIDFVEAHDRTRSQSLRIRERLVAATAVDDLDWRVDQFYPHPIAFGWRSARTHVNARQRYAAMLDFAENIVAILAAYAGASHYDQHGDDGSWRPMLEQLRSGTGGTTFGMWWSAVKSASGKSSLRGMSPSEFAVVPLHDGSVVESIEADVQALMAMRNDEAHGKRVGEHQLGEALENVTEHIRSVLSGIAFVTDFPLFIVERVETSSRGSRNRMTGRHVTGAFEVGDQFEREHDGDFRPASGEVYFEVPGRDPVSIHPYLVRMPCPECGALETYVLDKLQTGGVQVKSLERQHVHSSDAITRLYRDAELIDSVQ